MTMPENPAERTEAGVAIRGFTIVELLVVIAVLTLLLGLLLPALQSVKQTSRQLVEVSTARHLMVAYNAYANNHNGEIMPGYSDEMQARDEQDQFIPSPASYRYPWRIAPYLDYQFEGLYANENSELLDNLRNLDPDIYRYAVSLFPSLGLNASWLGGDTRENSTNPQFLQVFGRYFLKRISEAKRPDHLIVFCSARGNDINGALGSGLFEGYFVVQSPVFISHRWADEYDPDDLPVEYGYVAPRYGGSAVTAFLDGHADILPNNDLRDMRYWANNADKPDWKLQPRH